MVENKSTYKLTFHLIITFDSLPMKGYSIKYKKIKMSIFLN